MKELKWFKLSIIIIVCRKYFHFLGAAKNISSYFCFLNTKSAMTAMNAIVGITAMNTKKPSTVGVAGRGVVWEGVTFRGVSTNFAINMSLKSLVVLS